MTNQELEIAKQKMKDYRDFFGGELNKKYLIDEAKNIFDLENILNMHSDFIDDQTSDAQSNLSNFKHSIGVY